MNKKYEFTGETKEFNGRILRRIKRMKDGLIGGWIETEKNLSQSGGCFVYDESMVYDIGVFLAMERFLIMEKFMIMERFMTMERFMAMEKFVIMV